ncbi:MAG: phosphotransferase family protein, partial [Candidatus Dormibacteria bacterium]
VGHTEEGSVITHGEPHPGNLIHGARGLILIDWDTVALARPERDVWMLDDGTDEGLAPYVEASGRTLDPDALAFHRLAWTLTDVAAFTEIFRSDHEGHAGTEIKLQALIDALSGPPPDPHARLSRKRS